MKKMMHFLYVLTLFCCSCGSREFNKRDAGVTDFTVCKSAGADEYELLLDNFRITSECSAKEAELFISSLAGKPEVMNVSSYAIDYSWPYGIALQVCIDGDRVLGVSATKTETTRIIVDGSSQIVPNRVAEYLHEKVANFDDGNWMVSSHKEHSSLLVGVLNGRLQATIIFESNARRCVAGKDRIRAQGDGPPANAEPSAPKL